MIRWLFFYIVFFAINSCRTYDGYYTKEASITVTYSTIKKDNIIIKQYKQEPRKYYLIDTIEVSEKKFIKVSNRLRASE